MERSKILVNINNSLGSAWLHIEIETGEVDLDVSVFVVVCRAEQTNLLYSFEVIFCGREDRKSWASFIGKYQRQFQDFAYEIRCGLQH